MFKKSILIAATLVLTFAAQTPVNAGPLNCLVTAQGCIGPVGPSGGGHQPIGPGHGKIPPFYNPPVQTSDPGPFVPQPIEPPHHWPNHGPIIVVTGGDNGGGYDVISCGEGRSIVRRHGFKKVRAMDCSGDTFAFKGKKNGQWMEIDVDMNGDVVDVSSLY